MRGLGAAVVAVLVALPLFPSLFNSYLDLAQLSVRRRHDDIVSGSKCDWSHDVVGILVQQAAIARFSWAQIDVERITSHTIVAAS